MITRIFLAGLVASALAMAYSGDSFAAKFEAMPDVVQKTALANMEKALPVSISSFKYERGWEFQVHTKVNGENHDLVIDEKGKLLSVKDGTDLDSIPAAAKAVIEKQAASSEIVTLERVTENGLVSYGAVIKDEPQGKYVRVSVAADGTLKSKNSQDSNK
jgi:hypothetical protein